VHADTRKDLPVEYSMWYAQVLSGCNGQYCVYTLQSARTFGES